MPKSSRIVYLPQLETSLPILDKLSITTTDHLEQHYGPVLLTISNGIIRISNHINRIDNQSYRARSVPHTCNQLYLSLYTCPAACTNFSREQFTACKSVLLPQQLHQTGNGNHRFDHQREYWFSEIPSQILP